MVVLLDTDLRCFVQVGVQGGAGCPSPSPVLLVDVPSASGLRAGSGWGMDLVCVLLQEFPHKAVLLLKSYFFLLYDVFYLFEMQAAEREGETEKEIFHPLV